MKLTFINFWKITVLGDQV